MPHPPADRVKRKLEAAAERLLGPASAAVIRTAPGHIDVLGGLAVETGGTVAQMTVPRRAGVAVQLTAEPLLIIHRAVHDDTELASTTIPLDACFREGRLTALRDLMATLPMDALWAAPIFAAWLVLAQAGRLTALRLAAAATPTTSPCGATVIVHSELPTGAGLGSSTALLTSVMRAMAEAAGSPIEAEDLALYVGRAEDLLPDGFGHVVDALTALHALDQPDPHVLRLGAQPHSLAGQIRLPADLRILALDTTVRSGARAQSLQNLRVAGAMGLRIVETIYRDLGQRHTPMRGYLANISPALFRQYFRTIMPRRMRGTDFLRSFGAIPERAGTVDPDRMYRVRTTVDHLISDNEYAENFLQALEELAAHEQRTGPRLGATERQRTLFRAGRLMLASHHSYRLRLEQSCPEADWLVDALMQHGPQAGIYGARISGWGCGGTVVALVKRSPAVDEILENLPAPYRRQTGRSLVYFEAGTKGSAGLLT